MIKAIIFDLDGTLLDTSKDITNSVNYVLEKHGYKVLKVREVLKNLGYGSKYLIKNSLPEGISNHEFELIHQAYLTYYQDHNDILTTPYEGVLDLVNKLKVRGLKLALISNKDNSDVQSLIPKHFGAAFDVIYGTLKGFPNKPDSYLVNLTLNDLKVDNKQAIYIGDSEVDFQTAQNANLEFIAVSWGFRTKEFLENKGIRQIVDNPDELLNLIKDIKK